MSNVKKELEQVGGKSGVEPDSGSLHKQNREKRVG